MREVCGFASESAAADAFRAWVVHQPEFEKQIPRFENFLKQNGSTFLKDDRVLYRFCEHVGFPVDEHMLDGEPDVGDFLGVFARESGFSWKLAQYGGTYDIVRAGAYEIRDGLPAIFDQSFELEIEPLGRPGPHARFQYRDKANPDKPQSNKVLWHGRVVATADVLYLVGISEESTDAAMLMLWEHHPRIPGMLIGIQLAKLAPEEGVPEESDYVIARRIAAIAHKPGIDLDHLRRVAEIWVELAPRGTFLPVDKQEQRSNSRG